MLSPVVLARLKRELARDDPWRLESDPFELGRYRAMTCMLDRFAVSFESGLEIGCAAGAFTAQLHNRCQRLHVVDLLPEALERAHRRIGVSDRVCYTVADVAEIDGWQDTYDAIVMSEVIYYVGSLVRVTAALSNVARLVRSGGILVFGSATDRTVRRWGYQFGAESSIIELGHHLTLVEQQLCVGSNPNECAIIADFRQPI